MLSPVQLSSVLSSCRECFAISDDAEISLEANPDTVGVEGLRQLRTAGFNRISFGVQSFNDEELQRLGRIHDGGRAEQAVRDARRVGFSNLSLDLMYGLPGQTPASWRKTLERALALEPDHLSAYQLTIEENTVFAERAGRGELSLPAEEAVLEMDAISTRLSRDAGFEHYEISNYAQLGRRCRHNLVYWHNDEYFGFGAGAVSFLEGVRAGRVEDPARYCELVESGGDPVTTDERLSRTDSFRETVVMGLRLVEGISEERLKRRYGLGFTEVYGEIIDALAGEGLVCFDKGRLRLTGRGRLLANTVMSEFV